MSTTTIIGRIYDYTGNDWYLKSKGKVTVHGQISEADRTYSGLAVGCVWLLTPVGRSVDGHMICSRKEFS